MRTRWRLLVLAYVAFQSWPRLEPVADFRVLHCHQGLTCCPAVQEQSTEVLFADAVVMGVSSIAAHRSASTDLGFADPMYALDLNDHSGRSLCSTVNVGALPIVRVSTRVAAFRRSGHLQPRLNQDLFGLY